MLRFTKIAAILFGVGFLIARYSPNNVFASMQDIGALGLLVSGACYGFRLLMWIKRKVLWKVRNKVIISYAFVGIIPVLILAFIGWLSARLILGQLGGLYLENELHSLAEELHQAGDGIVLEFYSRDSRTEEELAAVLARAQQSIGRDYPKLADARFWLLKIGAPGRASDLTQVTVVESGRGEGAQLAVRLPSWAVEGFHGLVHDPQELFFRSVSRVRAGAERYLVYLDLPFNDRLMRRIQDATSMEVIRFKFPQPDEEDEQSRLPIWDFVSGSDGLADILWIHPLQSTSWTNGQLTGRSEGLVLSVPVQTLYEHYFARTPGLGPFVLYLIAVLGILFLLVEGISFFIGVAIARSITRSIHHLYTGTLNIQQGNFGFRIPNNRQDQLDAMAESFNNMAESIVQLMTQVSEQEWLEKEIEIAREVQAQLFPQRLPSIERLDIAGTCLPARRVSGDYYDFIPFGRKRLNTIVADISGKGISAALLMASLQSSLRTHILYQAMQEQSAGTLSGAVAHINNQLYHQTPPDKYATLVLSRFDATSMTLTYCNAGHNPPLLFCNGRVEKLSCGGTVAGLFEEREYQEETVTLGTDSLLVFYTDGVVEAENSSREMFGEERLIEIVGLNSFLTAEDIQQLILEEVSSWAAGQDQRDDITVVVLKVAP